MEVEKICYKIVRISDDTRKIRHYAVRVDEQGLFQELIVCSNALLQKKIEKEILDRNFVSMEFCRDKVMVEISKIKKLPWWKRLFNKF